MKRESKKRDTLAEMIRRIDAQAANVETGDVVPLSHVQWRRIRDILMCHHVGYRPTPKRIKRRG